MHKRVMGVQGSSGIRIEQVSCSCVYRRCWMIAVLWRDDDLVRVCNWLQAGCAGWLTPGGIAHSHACLRVDSIGSDRGNHKHCQQKGGNNDKCWIVHEVTQLDRKESLRTSTSRAMRRWWRFITSILSL